MENKEIIKESWIRSKWRPAIGWIFVAILAFDFIIAPIMWTVYQDYRIEQTQKIEQWDPLTIKGGGLLYVSIGSILTATAWGRSQEKLNGVAGDITKFTSRNS